MLQLSFLVKTQSLFVGFLGKLKKYYISLLFYENILSVDRSG
jgi:hypothetical protein